MVPKGGGGRRGLETPQPIVSDGWVGKEQPLTNGRTAGWRWGDVRKSKRPAVVAGIWYPHHHHCNHHQQQQQQ